MNRVFQPCSTRLLYVSCVWLLVAPVLSATNSASEANAVHERERLTQLLKKDPENRNARFALVKLESDSRHFDASLRTAEPMLSALRAAPDGILVLAKDYAGLGKKEPLLSLVHDWDALPPPPLKASLAFSISLSKAGMDQEALHVLERAKNNGQVSDELAAALGNLYLASGDLSRAFTSYEAALSLNPRCSGCLLQLAKIATQQKDPEKALAYLIRAKRAQPQDSEILFEFGKACLQLDLLDDALPALREASRLQPNNDSYSYVLASANVSMKQYATAARMLSALLAKRPNDGVLNYAMGSLLFLEVKYAEASTYLQKSITLQPDQSGAYYYLGLISEERGDNDQAAATFRDVLRRFPDYSPAYEALGSLLLKQHKYAEAQELLEKAIALNPDAISTHYQLGMVLARTGKQDEANRQFEMVKELNAEEQKRLGMRLRILSPH